MHLFVSKVLRNFMVALALASFLVAGVVATPVPVPGYRGLVPWQPLSLAHHVRPARGHAHVEGLHLERTGLSPLLQRLVKLQEGTHLPHNLVSVAGMVFNGNWLSTQLNGVGQKILCGDDPACSGTAGRARPLGIPGHAYYIHMPSLS